MRYLFFISLLFLFSSCDKTLKVVKNKSQVTVHKSTAKKQLYFTCNVFADETFHGRITNENENLDKNCFLLDINKAPKDFLRNETLFLQIYPFLAQNDKFLYGESLRLLTLVKSEKREKDVIADSNILDTFLVENHLKIDPDYFFLDHIFKICDVRPEWQGLQLVIYKKNIITSKNIPIRTTKILLPPFLIHPQHYKESQGDMLAAYHPFLEMIPDLQSKPSAYYDRAEDICFESQ